MIVVVDVDVDVIGPVIVAVHLNGNANVVVIDTVDGGADTQRLRESDL